MGDLERKCTHGCGDKFGLKIVKLVFILYPLFHTIINVRQKNVEHVYNHDMYAFALLGIP